MMLTQEPDVNEQDDMTLACAARTTPALFAILYQRYLARVYRYVRAHVTSESDAADVTQQIFTQAVGALPSFTGSGTFAAWLFRIARNCITDAYRHRPATISWDDANEEYHLLDEQSPEAVALQHEAIARLQKLLGRLAADKRELIALRFGAQLSVDEIAKIVGKKPEAVKKQIARTLQLLKERYDDA